MKMTVSPKRVSFEDALRNLASRLTGHPANQLPRTQEGIVQFMAENVPALDEMAVAIVQEVTARLAAASAEEPEKTGTGQQETQDDTDLAGDAANPGEGGEPAAAGTAEKPKRGPGSKAKDAESERKMNDG